MAIQQMLLGAGGAAKKTYTDDVFSTYVYAGNGSTKSINNGIDLSTGNDGLVWIKKRTGSTGTNVSDNMLFSKDLASEGTNMYTRSNSNGSINYDNNGLTSFNNNGFSLGSGTRANDSGEDYVSWTFRKEKGFFDIVTWTQSGSDGAARTLSHNLGCVPGFIMLKQYNGTEPWICWHRDFDEANQYLKLNEDHASGTDANASVNSVSSTQFVVGADNNKVGSYIAYVFAGGESGAATANSVDFGGDNSTTQSHLYLSPNNTAGYNFGTGDFTFECWVRPDGLEVTGDNWKRAWSIGTSGGTRIALAIESDGSGYFTSNNSTSWGLDFPSRTFSLYQWTHVAFVRESNVIKIYANGVFHASTSFTSSLDFSALGNKLYIGMDVEHGQNTSWNGRISNFRIVKGTAVYTSSFRPPTEPLTDITNTILLCCNHPTNKNASTVTVTTIAAYGNEAAGTDSPFDDPDGFNFGENKEGIVKCGRYIGNGSTNGPNIFIGWEPQWWLVKKRGQANWQLLDSMRGWPDGINDSYLVPNTDAIESTYNFGHPTSSGFKLTDSSNQNNTNSEYYYVAIRRPDGYVGKPAETGTDVFAMDTGNSSATIPCFDSGFPVDFQLNRKPNSNWDTYVGARLIQTKYLITNDTDTEGGSSEFIYDSNVGWAKGTGNDNTYSSWMWKRHAGFDVQTWTGDNIAGREMPHNLGKIPEMIWVKKRNASYEREWVVYHKGLNGGTNPEQYFLNLDTNAATQDGERWNDTAPTATHWTMGSTDRVNGSSGTYLGMLFASVDGISKIGYYNGSNSSQTITTGFQPRLLLVKRTNDTQAWTLVDSVRGWAQSTNDPRLELDALTNQITNVDFGYPTSTGFFLEGGTGKMNESGGEYIYYAHA